MAVIACRDARLERAAGFGGDFSGVRRFAERDHKNITQWHSYDAPGGHYAAHLEPALVTSDIQGFFRTLR